MASVIAVYGRRNFNPVLNLAVLQQPEHGKPPADVSYSDRMQHVSGHRFKMGNEAAPHPAKKAQCGGVLSSPQFQSNIPKM